jgi:hypothetical protein
MEVVVAWVVKPCEATPHPSETPQHRGYFRMLKLLIGPFLSSNRLMLTFFFLKMNPAHPKEIFRWEIDQTRSQAMTQAHV